MNQPGASGTSFSVLLVCYGDHADYSCRAITSLMETVAQESCGGIYIGCNACCDKTLSTVRQGIDRGHIAAAIESRANRHKDPMLRSLLDMVQTPYVLVMDDDSYVKAGWTEALARFIQSEDPIDVAGAVYLWPRSPEYQRSVENRPWWRGLQYVPDSQRTMFQFCTGGFFLARTAFLREHDFPDRDMVIQYDDAMLADLVYQVGGKLKAMPDSVLTRVVINDGKRRWTWEQGANDRVPGSLPRPSQTVTSRTRPQSVDAEATLRSALDMLRRGRYQDAEAACQQVLGGEPGHAGAIHLLGVVIHHTGRSSEAVQLIEKAIVTSPNLPDFHNSLGNVLDKLGRVEEAVQAFGRAISLRPQYAEAHNNLGNALFRMGQSEPALAEYRTALNLRPSYLEARLNLGHALGKLGRTDEAIAAFRKSAELAPGSPDIHNSLALLHQNRGELPQAITCLDQAIQLNPRQAQTRLNRALMLLATGNWEQGWEEYEWRWKLPDNHAEHMRFRQPLWDGGSLAGRTLLLHCEQGLGSTIQFIRYALLILERNRRVIVECQPSLKGLLNRLSPDIRVFARGEVLPAFDVQLPLMSAPRVLHTTLGTLPARIPYLQAEPSLVERWRARLAAAPGFKIGITWQGNTAYVGDGQRSIRLHHFAPLGQVEGVRLISLQKRRGLEQMQEAGPTLKLLDFPELDETAGPFMDTAAIMKNLDLVITSDTSIAHLAGALGVNVWVALCFAADWRWMIGREDSPWYPSMRLYRQSRPGDWAEVFQRIAADLRDHQP